MIRKGMWVAHADHGVGIAHALGPRDENVPKGVLALAADEAEFHKTDGEGATVAMLVVKITDIAQARWREIPEARRQLTREQFAALGYA